MTYDQPLPLNPMEEVFLDHEKMFKLKQEERVNHMIRRGKHFIKDLALNKQVTNLTRQHQFLKYQPQLDQFYNNNKIETITEDQVRSGLSNFNVLIDQDEVKHIKESLAFKREKQMEKEHKSW